MLSDMPGAVVSVVTEVGVMEWDLLDIMVVMVVMVMGIFQF